MSKTVLDFSAFSELLSQYWCYHYNYCFFFYFYFLLYRNLLCCC